MNNNKIIVFQWPERRRGFPRNSEEDLPEHPRRAAGPERGGVGRAAQAGVPGPPASRAARRQGQLRLLTEQTYHTHRFRRSRCCVRIIHSKYLRDHGSRARLCRDPGVDSVVAKLTKISQKLIKI